MKTIDQAGLASILRLQHSRADAAVKRLENSNRLGDLVDRSEASGWRFGVVNIALEAAELLPEDERAAFLNMCGVEPSETTAPTPSMPPARAHRSTP